MTAEQIDKLHREAKAKELREKNKEQVEEKPEPEKK